MGEKLWVSLVRAASGIPLGRLGVDLLVHDADHQLRVRDRDEVYLEDWEQVSYWFHRGEFVTKRL